MSLTLRQLVKRFHPQGIPWPASVFYNAISGSKIFRHHYDLVAEDLDRSGSAACILDIGTGPGRLLIPIRQAFHHAVLLGVDISPSMIAQAKRNVGQYERIRRIELVVAGAGSLPFADGSFDRVLSTGSFHHWKSPLGCLAEAHRILKVGGYALIYDLVRRMPETVERNVRTQFGGFRVALLRLYSFEEPFLDSNEMEALAGQTDFEVEGTRFIGALCCLVLRKKRPMSHRREEIRMNQP